MVQRKYAIALPSTCSRMSTVILNAGCSYHGTDEALYNLNFADSEIFNNFTDSFNIHTVRLDFIF